MVITFVAEEMPHPQLIETPLGLSITCVALMFLMVEIL
jgi:hypothetical protein